MIPQRHNRRKYASVINLVVTHDVQVKVVAQRFSIPIKSVYNILARYETDFRAQVSHGSEDIWGIKFLDLIA